MEKALFAINPGLDRPALARRFAERTRVQIRNVLTPETAREIQSILQASYINDSGIKVSFRW